MQVPLNTCTYQHNVATQTTVSLKLHIPGRVGAAAGARFKSRPGDRLSRLQVFRVFPQSLHREMLEEYPDYATIASFEILSKSLIINHPIIGCYIIGILTSW
jgi:hypothetical protein